MNIFILDHDVKKCAQYHCDKHVVKMILESIQMLSTTIRLTEGEEVLYMSGVDRYLDYKIKKEKILNSVELTELQKKDQIKELGKQPKPRNMKRWALTGNEDEIIYNATHINHPCNIWLRESRSNYTWLWDLTRYLGEEYTKRYGGKTHTCMRFLDDGILPRHYQKLPDIGLTKFANCTPYKDIVDTIEAYREYYRIDKRYFATWKEGCEVPFWFNKELENES